MNINGGFSFLVFLSQVNEWVNSMNGQQALQSYFASAAAVLSAISPIISALASVVMNELYPSFADFVSQAAPGVEELFSGMAEWIQPILDKLPEFGEALGEVIGAIDFESLGKTFATVMDIFTTVVLPVLETITPYIDEIVIAIGILVGAIEGIGLVLTVIEAGPIALIVAAIGAVVLAVTTAYRESETFRNILDGIGNFLKETFISIIQTVIDLWIFWCTAMSLAGLAIKLLWDKLWEIGSSIVGWVSGRIQDFTNFKNETTHNIRILKEKVVSYSSHLKDEVIAKFKDLKDNAVQEFEDLKAKVTEKVDMLNNGVQNAVNGVKEFFTGMGDKAGETKDRVSDAMSGAKDKLSSSFGKLGGKISENSQKLLGWDVSAARSSADMKIKCREILRSRATAVRPIWTNSRLLLTWDSTW